MQHHPAMERFPTGKLPNEVLAELLSRFAGSAPEVLAPPGVGYDATAIALGDQCLVVATDPITFAVSEIGWYSVMVNANDVACFGADPKWFLATLLLPEETADRRLVDELFGQIMEACRQIGAVLCGGHTEITHGLDRVIISGTMLGLCPRDELVLPSGIRKGDAVIATKAIAVEGTAVIAREMSGRLQGRVDKDSLERMRDLLHAPGISVVAEAEAARRACRVHAMHDVTEGGIATALRELAAAGGVGIEVQRDEVPVLDETRALTDALGFDPLGLLGSGTLLIAVAQEDGEKTAGAIRAAGVQAQAIGRAVDADEGAVLIEEGVKRPMPVFARDELARLLG